MNCLIAPVGKFGDHDKGLSGCTWCNCQKECIKKNPARGASLIFDRFGAPKRIVVKKIKRIKS